MIAWSRAWACPAVPADSTRAAQTWIGHPDEIPPAPILAPTAVDRAEASRRAAAARPSFLARRALLRRFVAMRIDVPPDRVVIDTDGGRPRLAPPHDALFVSASSREGWLAFAIGRRPLGIDLERVDAGGEPAWNVMTAGEQARLRELPPADRWAGFLADWTVKEAYLKAIGRGLAQDPGTVEVDRGGRTPRIRVDGRAIGGLIAESRTFSAESTILEVACVIVPATNSRW